MKTARLDQIRSAIAEDTRPDWTPCPSRRCYSLRPLPSGAVVIRDRIDGSRGVFSPDGYRLSGELTLSRSVAARLIGKAGL